MYIGFCRVASAWDHLVWQANFAVEGHISRLVDGHIQGAVQPDRHACGPPVSFNRCFQSQHSEELIEIVNAV